MIEQFSKNRFYLLLALVNTLALAALVFFLQRPEPRAVVITTPSPRPSPTPALVTVQLSGAVARPGVYTLPATERVTDALDLAGGTLGEANLESLNLARRLKDGEAIIIPTRAPTLTPRPTPSETPVTLSSPEAAQSPPSAATRSFNPSPAPTTAIGKVNINTAGLAELDTLPHIGPALAQRIIDYRLQNGPFVKIEDIKLVKGIGDSIFAELKDLITVD